MICVKCKKRMAGRCKKCAIVDDDGVRMVFPGIVCECHGCGAIVVVATQPGYQEYDEPAEFEFNIDN